MSEKPHLHITWHPNRRVRTFKVERGVLPPCIGERLEAISGVTRILFGGHEVVIHIDNDSAWMGVGPLVLGEIVKAVYPEVVHGGAIEITATTEVFQKVGKYQEYHSIHGNIVERQVVEVIFGDGPAILNVEGIFNPEAVRAIEQRSVKDFEEWLEEMDRS